MELFEGESLLKSSRQIYRAGVNEQAKNILGGDIDRRNMQKHFCTEETASFTGGRGWRSHQTQTEVNEFYSDIAFFETLF